jgi:hypothetical protein
MEHPEMLSEKTLPDLKQLLTDYPCFHAVRMLYLKNLATVDDIRLKTDLGKMAVYLPDRLRLFLLLEGDRYKHPIEPKPKKKDDKFELVDKFLSATGEADDSPSGTAFDPSPSPATDYTYWLSADDSPSGDSGAKLQHQELIDSFLEKNDRRSGNRLPSSVETGSGKVEEETDSTEPESADRLSLHESYFTETLSHVYIKQKRYDKALEIIKNLSLKYPEKSSYFADQIHFLEKLIIHTK